MSKPIRSPKDAPVDFRTAVEEFKVLAKQLGCTIHYAPSVTGDNPPDTIIVTNCDILQEQAVTQQVLETLLIMESFQWKEGALKFIGRTGEKQEIIAGSFIEAVTQVIIPKKSDD